MKPDVVLYGEAHPEGERVGEITRRDLMGPRPDLLLVVGTSLKVPGTKLLVRELAKVIRPPAREDEDDDDELEIPVSSGASTASGQRRRKRKPKPVHAVYLNLEFPTPSREFKDVFDVWMKGDVQGFIEAVEQERKVEDALVEKRRQEREVREHRKSLKGPNDSPRIAPRPFATVKRSPPKVAPATKGKPVKRKPPVRSALYAKKNDKKVTSSAGAGAARAELTGKRASPVAPLIDTNLLNRRGSRSRSNTPAEPPSAPPAGPHTSFAPAQSGLGFGSSKPGIASYRK